MFAKPGVAKQFWSLCSGAFEGDNKRWEIALSHYDVLCAFNMAAVHDVGPWDTMYFQYHADVDYYRTLRAAGWQELDSGLKDGVIHHGSQSGEVGSSIQPPLSFSHSAREFDHQLLCVQMGRDARGRSGFLNRFRILCGTIEGATNAFTGKAMNEKPSVAVVVGGANCVYEEYAAAKAMCDSAGIAYQTIVVNDMIPAF